MTLPILPIPPWHVPEPVPGTWIDIILTAIPFVTKLFDSKDKEKFQEQLEEIEEENKKALAAALAPIKTQQETRALIRREMSQKEQELLNYANTEVANRFDQLIELHVQQNVHNAQKCTQIEADLRSLANIEQELREIFSVVNYKPD